ncbi:MAG: hypothetical protein FWF28_00875 [Micrococcales bacterium]|nr:hypothetical protein [Micrococcales bacterium]
MSTAAPKATAITQVMTRSGPRWKVHMKVPPLHGALVLTLNPADIEKLAGLPRNILAIAARATREQVNP